MTKPKEGWGAGGVWQEGGSLYLSHKKGRLEKRPAAKNHTKSASLRRYSSAAAADGGDSSDGEQKGHSDTEETIRILEASVTRHLGRSAGRRSETFISWNKANMRMTRRE